MDFNLTEDQIMVRDLARELAEKRLAPMAEEMDEKSEMPAELLAEAAEMGFFGLMAPEEFGGSGVDTLSYALAIEEISKACAAFAIPISVHNSLVCKAIEMYGTQEQKDEYLPKLAAGEMVGAYSLLEPNSGTDAGSLTCQAIPDGDNYIFNGTKSWVSTAQHAGIFIVFALTDPEAGSKGISAILVEKETEGMSLGAPEKKMGMKCSDTRELSFMDAKVPRKNLLGEENLQGYASALDVDHGDGHVILLGMRPQWRGQPFGNFRIVFNAAFYSAEVAATCPDNSNFWQAPEKETEEESNNGNRGR